MDKVEYYSPSGDAAGDWMINGVIVTQQEVILNLARSLEKIEQLVKDPQAADFHPTAKQ